MADRVKTQIFGVQTFFGVNLFWTLFLPFFLDPMFLSQPQRQQNLNTEVGLDTNMTLKTPPHQPIIKTYLKI